MNICVISPDFPTSKTIDFVFVEQLCRAFSQQGEIVTVIAPQSLTKCLIRKIPITPKRFNMEVSPGVIMTVYRPKYITVGNFRGILSNCNKESFDKTVDRALNNLKQAPDVIYGHFWESVRAAFPYAHKHNIPLFVASGEELVTQQRIDYTNDEVQRISRYLCGAINVSTNNQKECIEVGLHTRQNSRVIPNSIDNSLFKPLNREECRRRIGVEENDFVVAFVGQMTQRKGPLRLDQALSELNDDRVKAIFIGKGNQEPTYKQILVHGTIPHSDLPLYLSASDVFVLPTLHEGCCNAIIEAMACGVPIISSNLPFNYDILNDENSIMVNPECVNEIKSAISVLINDPSRREAMAKKALEKASELTLPKRADKIISFIQSSIRKK